MKINTIFLSLFFLSFWCLAQEEQKIFKTATIKITATDYENIPRPDELITLQSKHTQKEFIGVTDSLGKVDIIVPKGDTFKVFQRSITHFVQHGEIEIPKEEGKFTMNLKLELKVLESDIELAKKTFIMDMFFFESGLNLTKESTETIENLYHVMQGKPSLQIEIAGHTDNTGNNDDNIKLSQERANLIKNYLINKGIDASRIDAKGYGSAFPISTNETAAGKAQNRRIEVKIINN